MRHGRKFNHLGVDRDHRKLLLANLAKTLILKKRIVTTLAKAKALRVYVEPLISKSRLNTTHSRREVFATFQDKKVVKELFSNVGDLIGDRPGGYLRILNVGKRLGDNAELAIIEFVDFNKVYVKKNTRRDTKKKNVKSGVKKIKKQERGEQASTTLFSQQ
ncbi:MAG: 50S ribosomal protein L17 [Cytophagales bacterium]|jgi:large subunit ribosomal protein L17|nr:50S ribosomal protein L17 [Cytophagales bacterium]